MRTVPTSTITVAPSRQRRTFDEKSLIELADSIARNGLLHPIVVRFEGGKTFLVAGERRLRAVEILGVQGIRYKFGTSLVPEGHIPINELGELEPDEAWEAELEENLQRVNLSWQERTEAIANLHKLRELRAGRTLAPSETALEILGEDSNPVAASQSVRRALILQEHIAQDEEIAKAKTEQDAWRIIKKRENEQVFKALAASAANQKGEALRVFHGDCLEILPTLGAEIADCIITDPPYGINAHEFGDAKGILLTKTHDYKDSPEATISLLREVAPKLFHIAKKDAHLYLFCDIEHFLTIREIFASAGWTPFRTPIVYLKKNVWRAPWPEYGPRRAYELVFFAMKGKRPVTALFDDYYEGIPPRNSTFSHGGIKPVTAYTGLLQRTCRPGDLIIDPFAGSGPVLDAAKELRLRAIAIEKEATYYGMCLKRLEAFT